MTANNIQTQWPTIKAVFEQAKNTSQHCAIASVGEDGSPHITPIGSLFLGENCTGYYLEEYSKKMATNFLHDNRVCILAVNSGALYWLRSLVSGRFSTPPGIRLYGTVGKQRMGTDKEIAAFQDRVKKARSLKGYKIMWENMKHVREITFDSFRPVQCSKMTSRLWEK